MKKLLLMLVAVCSMALTFSSCKKDKDDAPDSMNGTEWAYVDSEYPDFSVTLKFAEKTYTMTVVDGETYERGGTYVYAKPKVTVDPNSQYQIEGIVNGNTITVDDEGDIMVFHKK